MMTVKDFKSIEISGNYLPRVLAYYAFSLNSIFLIYHQRHHVQMEVYLSFVVLADNPTPPTPNMHTAVPVPVPVPVSYVR